MLSSPLLISEISTVKRGRDSITNTLRSTVYAAFYAQRGTLRTQTFICRGFHGFRVIGIDTVIIFDIDGNEFRGLLSRCDHFLINMNRGVRDLQRFLATGRIDGGTGLLDEEADVTVFDSDFRLFLLPCFFFTFLSTT